MSWLKTTAGELLAGEDAKALGTFLDVFGKLVDDGVPPSEALEQVRRKSEEAVRRIAEHYLGDTAGQLADEVQRLRKPLWNFEEAPGEKDRQFGWPQKAASKDASGEGYSFTLAAEAGAVFEVLPGKGSDANDGDDGSNVQLRARGKVSAGFGGQIAAGAGIGAAGEFARAVRYQLAYDDDARTGRALADALSRVTRLDDFGAVLGAFDKAPMSEGPDTSVPDPLRAIVYTGCFGLEAEAEGEVTVPLAGGGAELSGRIRAHAEIADEFEARITRPQTGTLRIEIEGGKGRTRALELGLRVKAGIAALAPELARDMLDRIAKADPLFDRIDAVLKEDAALSTWLKPGSALHGLIKKKVAERTKDGSALLEAIAALSGLSGEELPSIAEKIETYAADLLADAVDRSLDLFELPDHDAFERIEAELADRLQAVVPGVRRRIAVLGELDDLVKEVQALFTEKLEEAAGSIDAEAGMLLRRLLGREPGDAIEGLREVLSKARKILDQVGGYLASQKLDTLAIGLSWGRTRGERVDFKLAADIVQDGALFYRQAIQNPRAATAAVVRGARPAGVALSGSSWVVTERRTDAQRKAAVSLFGVTLSGTDTSLAEIRVHETASGVSVMTRGQFERERPFLSDTRRLSFASLIASGAQAEAAPEFKLTLGQEDRNLEPGEAKQFLSVFKDVKLCSYDLHDSVVAAVTEADRPGGKLTASLQVALGIPADRVAEVISKAAGDGALTGAVACEALCRSSWSRGEIKRQLEATDRFLTDDRHDEFLRLLGVEAGSRRRGRTPRDSELEFDHVQVLGQAREIVEILTEQARRERSARSEREKMGSRALALFENIVKCRTGFTAAFERLDRARQRAAEAGELDDDARRALAAVLEKEQAAVNRALEPWFKIGLPGLFDRPPARPAELFWAIAELSRRTLGLPQSPRALFSLTLGEQQPRVFIDRA